MRRKLSAMLLLGALQWASAQRVGVPTEDLTSLSVDDLFQVQVTSVGRKAQQRSRAPAAVYVLTSEDIRRSGATSVPEALQWVPGLTVLPVDGRSWAISARGSARLYSDKILVMVDGRSLYTPLFSGVIWDFLNVPLENIEQIEVVRGPGTVMWGTNAVNGVINIITRKSKHTAKVEVGTAVGNDLRASGFVSWSASPSERLSYRVWGRLEDRDPADSAPGRYLFNNRQFSSASRPVENLESRTASAGVRVDGELSTKDELMVQGDVYGTGRDEVLGFPVLSPGPLDEQPGRTTSQGGSLQLRWTRSSSAGNEGTLQFTFDDQRLDYPFVDGHLNNVAVDYQRRHQTGEQNEVYWGVGYQQYWDNTNSLRFVGFSPGSATYRVTDLVVRNEWQPVLGRLLLSAGMRVDYSWATRFHFQPSIRLLYTPSSRQSVWVAVSRAARIPNRFDRDMRTDGGYDMSAGFPVKLDIVGSTAMRAESELSAEAGYRFQSRQRWSVDTAVFWNYHLRLRVLEFPQMPEFRLVSGVPTAQIALEETNRGKGRTYGSETSVIWQVREHWRISPSYSYMNERLWTPPSTAQFGYSWLFISSAPHHQGLLRSQHDIGRRWQIDCMARGRSPNAPFQLPGVVRADVRLAFRPVRDSELSLSIRNVTGREEFDTYSEAPFVAIPLRRSVVVRWTLQL